ncbi:hypothetical protein, partial [Desulfovibrio sp.]|uniref:hypothetical protein n=1 Tax=Desulfovibrio sp. TaxID=885 RepID=UPI00307913F6
SCERAKRRYFIILLAILSACHLPRPGKERVRQAEKEPPPVRQMPGRLRMTAGASGESSKEKNGRLAEEGFCLPCNDTQK